MDMSNSLFVTGASGFVGSRFIQQLNPTDYDTIYCMCRTPSRSLQDVVTRYKNVHIIEGDINKPEQYRTILATCRTVVHIAALTGKASRDEYFACNSVGTRTLAEQSKQV